MAIKKSKSTAKGILSEKERAARALRETRLAQRNRGVISKDKSTPDEALFEAEATKHGKSAQVDAASGDHVSNVPEIADGPSDAAEGNTADTAVSPVTESQEAKGASDEAVAHPSPVAASSASDSPQADVAGGEAGTAQMPSALARRITEQDAGKQAKAEARERWRAQRAQRKAERQRKREVKQQMPPRFHEISGRIRALRTEIKALRAEKQELLLQALEPTDAPAEVVPDVVETVSADVSSNVPESTSLPGNEVDTALLVSPLAGELDEPNSSEPYLRTRPKIAQAK